jgi:1-acyl-sn-glycerol-3-phosphate acyltransferase
MRIPEAILYHQPVQQHHSLNTPVPTANTPGARPASSEGGPDRGFDPFGLSPERYARTMAFFGWYYRYWLRVEATGLENVPSSGGALLVGNHAGLSGLDAIMLLVAMWSHHSAHRPVRALHHVGSERQMIFGHFLRQYCGTVLAHPRNARTLLDRGELVLTYPEGGHSTKKRLSQRLQLCPDHEFGAGFISLALDAGVPVIPIATTGVERAVPTIFLSRLLGRYYKMDGGLFPVSPQFLVTFVLPFLIMFIPFPVKCRISIGPAIDMRTLIGDKTDPQAVLAARSSFRQLLQAQVSRLAATRTR